MSEVLIFSATTGYRHESIAAGVAAMRELATADGYAVDATEDPGVFTPDNLARYAAVVFMNSSGTVFDDAGRSALRSYVGAGGGYVGVHLAAGTEYDWPYYGGLVGAFFDAHPQVQPAAFEVEDRTHPATGHLPRRWERVDELYNYRSNPRPDVHVLITLDESSYSGGTMGTDHPITWCHRYEGGRAFYTGAGHTIESYDEPAFRTLLLGGLRYAAGTAYADDRPEHGYVPLEAGDVADWSSPERSGWSSPERSDWSSPERSGRCSVKFGWRDAGKGGSARIGVPDSVDPTDAARSGGYEIRLDDPTAPLNAVGEWNTYEISIADDRAEAYVNGVRTLRVDGGVPAGRIWLGSAGDGCFRDIRVRREV
jgi:type 1 glutamine amidotransferase